MTSSSGHKAFIIFEILKEKERKERERKDKIYNKKKKRGQTLIN